MKTEMENHTLECVDADTKLESYFIEEVARKHGVPNPKDLNSIDDIISSASQVSFVNLPENFWVNTMKDKFIEAAARLETILQNSKLSLKLKEFVTGLQENFLGAAVFSSVSEKDTKFKKIVTATLIAQMALASCSPVGNVMIGEVYVNSNMANKENIVKAETFSESLLTIDNTDKKTENFYLEHKDNILKDNYSELINNENIKLKSDGELIQKPLQVEKYKIHEAESDLLKQDVANSKTTEIINIIENEINLKEINPLIYRIVDLEHPISPDEIASVIEPNLINFTDYYIKNSNKGQGVPVMNENLKISILAASDLTDLLDTARAEEISLYAYSGFRSYYEQSYALNEVHGDTTLVMLPGCSQHQSGLAIDFSTPENGHAKGLYSGFDNTKAKRWLTEHAWEYGFVMSYINGHDGVNPKAEGHHFIYVGKDLARILRLLDDEYNDSIDVFDLQKIIAYLGQNIN